MGATGRVFALIGLLSLSGCAQAPACPTGSAPSPRRQHAIASRLRNALASAELDPAARSAMWRALARPMPGPCFGPLASVSVEGGPIVLDGRLSDAQLAARLGHLLLHTEYASGPPASAPGSDTRPIDCEAHARDAMRSEAVALSAELALLSALGQGPGQLPDELVRTLRATPVHARAERVRRYLIEHPGGVPGLGSSLSAYRERCRRAS